MTFSYEDDDRKILQALNFQVYPGEQVTLSGRTGAGKSTVFKLLLGLYQPGEGKVLIQGRDAFQIPEHEKRSLYGYVEQTFHRVPGTVKDQITLYDDSFTMEEVRGAARIAGLDATIEQLEKAMILPAPRRSSPRDSGSCYLLPELRWRSRSSFCWMRLRQIWMPRPRKRCCRH